MKKIIFIFILLISCADELNICNHYLTTTCDNGVIKICTIDNEWEELQDCSLLGKSCVTTYYDNPATHEHTITAECK